LLLLAMLAGGAGFAELLANFTDSQERVEFLTYTATAAAALEPAVVAGFQGDAGDAGTLAFDVVREELKRIRAAAPNARFVYLMAKKDGKWIFLADSEDPSSPAYSPPGQVYTDDSTGLERVLATGAPTVEGPSRDRWGVWVSGEAPIKDTHSGRTIAVFGIDIAADIWAQQVSDSRWFGIGISALIISLTAMFGGALYIQGRRREAQEQLGAIVESSNSSIIGGDRDGNCTSWNIGAERIYGYSAREMIGQPVATLVPAERLGELQDQITEVLSGGEVVNFETVRIRKDGRAIDVSETISPIRNSFGNIVGASAIVVDISERKRAERERQESQVLYQSVVAALSEGVVVQGADGAIRSCNDSAERILGLTRDQMVGRTSIDPIWRAVHEDGSPFLGDAHPAMITLRTGQPCHEVIMGVHKSDGSLRWISINTQPMFRAGEALPYAVVTSFVDITERKRTEARLRTADRIVENSSTVLYRTALAPKERLTFVSDNVSRYGYRPEDLIGKQTGELLHPDDLERVNRENEALTKSSSGNATFEYRMRIGDGTYRWIEDRTTVFRDSKGEPVGLEGILNDITERRQAEEAMRASEGEYRGLFEVTRDAIMTIEPSSWNFTSGNPAAIKMFGASSEEEFVSYGPWELSPEKQPDGRASAEKAKAMVETTLREGSHLFEWTHRRIDGVAFPADVLLTRMVQGGRVMLHATVRDISERKQADRTLLRVNRALKTLSEANEALVRAPNQEDLFRQMCRVIVEAGGYRMAWIGLAEDDPGASVRTVARAGLDDGYLDVAKISWANNERGRAPTGTAIRTRTVQINRDFASNPSMGPWRAEALKRGYGSSIALPLLEDQRAFGALTIYAQEPEAFGAEEARLLTELARDLSYGVIALRARDDHLAGLQRLGQAMEETVRLVAATVEMHDRYTAGHQRRVAAISAAIAKEMGLSSDMIHGLRLAGTLHDLGKINIPADILSKPGKLSLLEYELIKTHPQTGYDVLKPVEFPWPIADMVLQHHERLDGSGYPRGLKGDAILLEARIIAVADVVESMISHRPYRPALGVDVALAEIQEGSGKLYDPAVVDACLKLFSAGDFKFD
jgi:PAS domain S-box-containing protein